MPNIQQSGAAGGKQSEPPACNIIHHDQLVCMHAWLHIIGQMDIYAIIWGANWDMISIIVSAN